MHEKKLLEDFHMLLTSRPGFAERYLKAHEYVRRELGRILPITIETFMAMTGKLRGASPEEIESDFPRIMETCKLIARKSPIGHGYSIELRGHFIYESPDIGTQRFEGLFMTLADAHGSAAGVMEINIGSAGRKGTLGVLNTFGENFDTLMMNHLVGLTGEAFSGHPDAKSPVHLNLMDQIPNRKLKARLSRYVEPAARELFVDKSELKRFPIRPELFAKGAELPRDNNPNVSRQIRKMR
jgi:hypothetical protein